MAWQCISPEVTGFTKCSIFHAVDGTDDDILWIVCEGNGDIRSECEEDDGTDCEVGNSDTDW